MPAAKTRPAKKAAVKSKVKPKAKSTAKPAAQSAVTSTAKPANLAAYLAPFPPATRARLQQVHDIVQAVAPDAVDVISYAMPAFELEGRIMIYFAGFARHVGLYPGAAAIAHFTSSLTGYHFAKGSLQLPLDAPLPVELVQEIATFCAAQNRAKASARKRA